MTCVSETSSASDDALIAELMEHPSESLALVIQPERNAAAPSSISISVISGGLKLIVRLSMVKPFTVT